MMKLDVQFHEQIYFTCIHVIATLLFQFVICLRAHTRKS